MTEKQDPGKDWSKILDEDSTNPDEVPMEDEGGIPPLMHPSYKQLEDELTAAEMLAHQNWEKAARAVAELDNVRRRAKLDVENAYKFSIEKFVRDLLPVIDSLEHAQAAIQIGNHEAIAEGVELTLKLFLDVLKKFEIEPIHPLGELFNPEQHEAMTMQPSKEYASNIVMEVFQKGYLLNGRVIRPARVVVAKNE